MAVDSMTVASQVLLVVTSALLSSGLTLVVAFFFLDRYYKRRLQREIDDRVATYTERLQEAIDQEVVRAGDLIEARVRQGMLEAIASIPSSQVILKTTDTVVKTSVDIVEAGLSTFLGGRPRNR